MRGVEHAGDAGLFVELPPPQVDVEEAAAAATLESDALLPDEAARITVGRSAVAVIGMMVTLWYLGRSGTDNSENIGGDDWQ